MDAALLSALASVGGLVLVALALVFDVHTLRTEHARQRRQTTIETYFDHMDLVDNSAIRSERSLARLVVVITSARKRAESLLKPMTSGREC